MNVQQSRHNSASASSVVVSHFTALEKLRRLIFAPVRRRVGVGALVALLAGTSAFAQTGENGSIVFDPTSDIKLGLNDFLSLRYDESDLKAPNNDPSKTITLDGGCLCYEGGSNDLLIGEGSGAKNFDWGSGGIVEVIDSQVKLGLKRSGNGADVSKFGAGIALFLTTDNEANNAHRFGSLYVFNGKTNFCSADFTATNTTFDGDVVLYYEEQVDETSGQTNIVGTGGASFLGDVTFNKNFQLSYLNTTSLLDGNATFEQNVFNYNGSRIALSSSGINGETTPSAVFNGLYSAENSSSYIAYEGSTTTFNDVVSLDKGSIIGGNDSAQLIFNSNLICESGSGVHLEGDSVLVGTGVFSDKSYLHIQNGETNVEGNIGLYDGSNLGVGKDGVLNFADKNQFILDGDSFAMLYGSVNFNDSLIVVSNNSNLYAGGGVQFGEEALAYLVGGGNLVGYASTTGKVDVIFDATGEIRYSDLLAKHNVISTESKPTENPVFYTVNELNERTYLIGSGIQRSIIDAETTNQIVNRQLFSEQTGDGHVGIHSYLQTSLAEYCPGQVAGYNGYAVIFDDANRDQLFTTFSGNTDLLFGTAILKGGTVYGAGTESGMFNVYGQSYSKDDEMTEKFGQTIYRSVTSGVLAFYRGDETDANVAPTLQAYGVCFDNGRKETAESESLLGGARIWLDASYSDPTSDRKLGTIKANTIFFGDKTQIYYDGISSVDSAANLTFDLDAQRIAYKSRSTDATQEEIENLFGGAQLVDASYKTEIVQNDDGNVTTHGTVTIKALNVADYAASNDMTQKEQDYAAKLDVNRLASSVDTAFYDALYNENDATKVRQTIHNLSIGGYQMLNAYGHFGNPTSSFFGGSTISGEHKRAQSLDPDYDPLEERDRQAEQQSAIANAPVDDASRAIWGAYTNTTVDGDEYDSDGITMNGYRLRRQGIVGGLRRQIDGSTSGGLFFGLSNPEINSTGEILGGYGNYGSRMEMDDFQFAGHFEKIVGDFWEIAAYVGGGTQSMDWRRDLYLNEGGRYRFEADGAGNTLTGTLYLANRIDLSENATFRPTIGVDSEHSWLYGFDEIQTVGGKDDEVNAYMRWLAQSYAYDQTYYNRNTARAGARFNWSGSAGIAGLNAQAFYAVKLGGKDAPLISYRSQNYSFDNMETHAMGNESFSVGGGGFLNLNRAKTLTATGDFNAVWYKNATTQNVTGGLTYRF